MNKILAVTAIVTLVFGNAVYAGKSRYRYEARRTVQAGFQVDEAGLYISPDELQDRAISEACGEAVKKCQQQEKRECRAFQPRLKFSDAGYGVTEAEIICAAENVVVFEKMDASRSVMGLFSE